MDRNLKGLLLTALTTGLLCWLVSCTSQHVVNECRHKAVECALAWGEKVGNDNVGIAIGPTKTAIWHGQAYVKNPHRWLVNTGTACEIGRQEDFKPQVYMTLKQFIEWQFGWVK